MIRGMGLYIQITIPPLKRKTTFKNPGGVNNQSVLAKLSGFCSVNYSDFPIFDTAITVLLVITM